MESVQSASLNYAIEGTITAGEMQSNIAALIAATSH